MRQMFEDEKGKLSNLRVMSFIVLTWMIITSGFTIWKGQPVDMEFTGFLGICAFCPKLVQKFAESRFAKKE